MNLYKTFACPTSLHAVCVYVNLNSSKSDICNMGRHFHQLKSYVINPLDFKSKLAALHSSSQLPQVFGHFRRKYCLLHLFFHFLQLVFLSLHWFDMQPWWYGLYPLKKIKLAPNIKTVCYRPTLPYCLAAAAPSAVPWLPTFLCKTE